MIVRDPRILSSEWMLFGRQEVTSHGGRVDLLANTPDASLVLIEPKRDRTPREIIAQTLDYASWVEQLTPDRVAQIFTGHREAVVGELPLSAADSTGRSNRFAEHLSGRLAAERLTRSLLQLSRNRVDLNL